MNHIHFTIQGQNDINALRLAQVCTAGKDEVRYYLQGVCFNFFTESTVVGTDGSILVKTQIYPAAKINIPSGELIVQIHGAIPRPATAAHFTLPDDYTEGRVTFVSKTGRPIKEVPAQVIDAIYPKYEQVLENLKSDTVAQEKISFNPELISRAAKAVTPGHKHSNNVDPAFPIASVVPGSSNDVAMTVELPHLPEATILLMPVRL